tara:strand:- start:317 stop:559 length:243 start_codon:yes stop_codon:yes gene_type:complete
MSVALKEIRKTRNELLAECDWTLLPSSPLSAEKQNEWKVYRQALRDMPNTVGSIAANITFTPGEPLDLSSIESKWPEKPS